MDQELKAKWTAALRSGEYKQGAGRLRRDTGYCCLGVLGEIMHATYHSYSLFLPRETAAKAGLTRDIENELSDRNDGTGDWALMVDGKPVVQPHSFAQIADYIDANL